MVKFRFYFVLCFIVVCVCPCFLSLRVFICLLLSLWFVPLVVCVPYILCRHFISSFYLFTFFVLCPHNEDCRVSPPRVCNACVLPYLLLEFKAITFNANTFSVLLIGFIVSCEPLFFRLDDLPQATIRVIRAAGHMSSDLVPK